MRKFTPTIIIIAIIALLGRKVINDGLLFSTLEKDEVTKYVEGNKNAEIGKDIDETASAIRETIGIMAEAILGKEKTISQEKVVIKASENTVNKFLKEKDKLEEAELIHVIDGDTLLVVGEDSMQYKVRLIGIDTPESVHADESKNNQYGELSSDYTKALLDGIGTVYLEYDEMQVDMYNRVLAYVWLSPDTSNFENMLNARILYEGYAVDKVFEPNIRYKKEFEKLRKEAEKNERGLWTYIGYQNLIYEKEQ